MDIKIFVSCHKPSKIVENDLLYPIEVGSKLKKEHIKVDGIFRDDSGENISAKNPFFCELTAQYWAWKNAEADYYGFFHYRRYLSFSHKKFPTNSWQNVIEDRFTKAVIEKYGWTEDIMKSEIEKYDFIISEEKNVSAMPDHNINVYEQYKNGNQLHIEDLDIVRDIIKERHPEYLTDFDRYIHGKKTCLCNLYIMKREIFVEYMEWLFDILFEFERRADMSDYSIEGLRTPGHLAERLLTLFYIYKSENDKNIKTKTLQTVMIDNTELKQSLSEIQNTKPAFASNNIAIALAANEEFVPYMDTTLLSIMENSSVEYNYDVIILTQDISAATKDIIEEQFVGYKNLSIRYIDPSALIDDYEFYVRGHFSKETYYRLVLPELLPNYDKILYLDSDMIVNADVAKLYKEDIQDYLLAACHDADTAGLYNGFEEDKKDYTDNILKLKEPYQYFQAGTILFNLDKFRKTYSTKEILDFANAEEWQLLDQDILNKLCEGKVKYVDMSWNVMVDYAGIRIKEIISKAPKWLNDLYMESRKNQRIIHYAGPEKPWFYPEMDQGHEFWKVARKTPYYETMLFRMSVNSAKLEAEKTASVRNNGNIIVGGFNCIREHGLMYTLGYMPKKFFK